MDTRKAFIHIGFPKTGTTTLQAFLHNHNEDLLRHGVLYPNTGKLWHAQHELAGLFQNDEERLYWVKTDPKKPYLELLKEEVKIKNATSLVLSSEAFTFTNNHLNLKEFINECGFEDVNIVCFLRRQDLWVESAFTQLYKAGLLEFDFSSYANNQKRLDYYTYLDEWANVFGEDNIHIEIIDKELGHVDVVPAMLKILNVEDVADKYLPERYNATLSPDALHYSHLIHKENNNQLLGWLIEILEKYSVRLKAEKFIFQVEDERISFLQKYELINEKFAKKYLGRDIAFSEFKGFSKPGKLYPELNCVDMNVICQYVENEIYEKIVSGQDKEWFARKEFIQTENIRIQNMTSKIKTNQENTKIKRALGGGDMEKEVLIKEDSFPKVAIITRTKNRPIMLPRVLISISRQTFKNFIWVLVNDAGVKEPVDEIASRATENGIDVLVIHRDQSIGMEAASNEGVHRSDSEYIIIHDDDDTWEEAFLEKTVDYLDENRHVPGVITWTNRIDETLDDDCIRFQGVSPYNHWLQNIYLSDMAMENRFPPISFLFRRSVYDKVGGFDEELPVLGDWDFHLKVLMEGDIHVLPYVLANYHFRINLDKGNIYGNTVTSGVDKHILYDAIYRNKKLREDIKNGISGIGTLLALGQMFRKTNYMSDMVSRLGNASKSSWFLSLIRKALKV